MNTSLSLNRESNSAQDASTLSAELARLSVAQQAALEWLVTGGSVGEAAQLAGVARQTVSHWMHHDPDFQQAYQQWREQTLRAASQRFSALAEVAVQTLASEITLRQDARAAQFVIKQLGIGKEKPAGP